MSKKIFLLLTLFCFLAGSVQAGGPRPRFKRSRIGFALKKDAVTRTLEKRVKTTYQTALAAQKEHPRSISHYFVPTEKFNSQSPLNFLYTKDLYPDVKFLVNTKQKELYLLSQINREISRNTLYFDDLQEQIQARLEDFKRAQIKVTHSAQKDITWLADQIPAETSYLLLGEIHRVRKVHPNVISLLKEIRLRNPDRPIFLFTEFVLRGSNQAINDEIYERFFAPLEADKELDIPVIGLESEFVRNIYWTIKKEEESSYKQMAWATLEGLRIRNTSWLKIIQRYREAYPEALFVIYTGMGHTTYTIPHSLGKALQGPETFVISFFPNYVKYKGSIEEMTTFFDDWTDNYFAEERILLFDDPELARLSGADIKIKVENRYPVLKRLPILCIK